MRNEEIMAELSALRAEVQALAEARQEREPESAPDRLATSVSEAEGEGGGEHEGLMGHAQELVELLEEELKETPVLSGLAIFSIGILVGRFLR